MKFLLVAAIALLPSMTTVASFAMQDDEKKQQDPGAGIQWRSDEGKQIFDEAYALYESGEFKESNKLFKKAQSKAKDKKSKNKVKAWVLASIGAAKLVELKADKSGTGEVLRKAQQSEKLFRGTPIGPEFAAFVAGLRDKMYVSIEDFDRVSGRYSEKQGKVFVDGKEEPDRVKQGERSLEWKILTSPAELKIKKLPKDLASFRSVAFWLHFEKGKGARYEVVFMGKGSAKEQTSGKSTRNGFATAKAPHRGWQRIEIPLKRFTSYGKVSWETVNDFRIRFEGQKGFKVLVDDIVLIRK